MFSKAKPKKIIITALDINRNNENFDSFNHLPANEKLMRITDSIQAICTQLQESEPNAHLIIAWREYGITDGPYAKTVNPAFKDLFTLVMKNLTEQFPNLTIVAGTIATRKEVEKKSRLMKIKQYYHEHRDLIELEAELEKDSALSISKPFKLHEHAVDNALAAFDSIIDQGESIYYIRNTCYLFNSGESEIQRHSKITPIDETKWSGLDPLSHAIFQPGKGRSKKSIFDINHPDGSQICSMAVEICRENCLGVTMLEQQMAKGKNPDIQLILSDSIILSPQHIVSRYVLQLDSMNKPRLIVNEDFESDIEVEMFFYDALSNRAELVGPVAPIWIFEKLIVDSLNQLINTIHDAKKANALKLLRDGFAELSHGMLNEGMCDYLIENFTNKKIRSILLKKPKQFPIVRLFIGSPKNDNQVIHSWINRIVDLARSEKQNNPVFKRYIARSDPAKK